MKKKNACSYDAGCGELHLLVRKAGYNQRKKEIDTIKKFLNDHHDVEVRPIDIKAGKKIVVQSGILMGKEGTVKKVMHKKVEVVIESIGLFYPPTLINQKLYFLENNRKCVHTFTACTIFRLL